MTTTRRSLLAASAGAGLLAPGAARRAAAQSPAGVIVIAKQIVDIISLDPGECFEYSGSEICGNVYQKLFTTPNSNPAELAGELVERWDVAEDRRTFTFTLRDGPKFSSGRPVTAEDAAWSLGRAVILNKASAFIINQFGYTRDNVAEMIRATGPRTLVMRTAEPTAPSFLLYCLSATVGGVVEKAEALSHAQGDDLGNNWLKQNSAGSGPYRLRAWRASESVTLDANPHALVAPRTPRIILRHIPDPSAQLLGLQRGDIDIARNLSSDQITQARGDTRYTVTTQRKASLMHLAMNQKNANLAKPEVRQAIKLAIDYDGIQKNIVPNLFAVHQAFLPEGFAGALTDKPFHHQTEEAKRLLAQAGLAAGFEVSLDYASVAPVSDIAEAIQANLAEIGIRLRMLPAENRQVLTKMRARQHELSINRWGSDYFDPNSNAETYAVNSDNSDNARNRTTAWYSSWYIPEMSARVEAARVETDAAKRAQMYLDLQKEHQQTSPFAILLQESEVAVSRAGVSGFEMGPMNDRHRYNAIAKA
ncbi:ABC transporter substrate-binding protein [Roseomonas sp. BN140053]|uniref:ABC transporter substrate-binding protein n=1 Tax=Roseomonas sp. BN140053 TaxID=3391898 RepID=UPI0039E81A57